MNYQLRIILTAGGELLPTGATALDLFEDDVVLIRGQHR